MRRAAARETAITCRGPAPISTGARLQQQAKSNFSCHVFFNIVFRRQRLQALPLRVSRDIHRDRYVSPQPDESAGGDPNEIRQAKQGLLRTEISMFGLINIASRLTLIDRSVAASTTWFRSDCPLNQCSSTGQYRQMKFADYEKIKRTDKAHVTDRMTRFPNISEYIDKYTMETRIRPGLIRCYSLSLVIDSLLFQLGDERIDSERSFVTIF